MPILSSYQVIEKKGNCNIKQLDVIHIERTNSSERIYNLVPKLVYGDSEINWKYAFGMRKGKSSLGDRVKFDERDFSEV